MKIKVWHGSKQQISRFDPEMTVDRGLHFGSRDQALMRNRAWLHEVEIEIEAVRRCKDTGSGWSDKIRSARAAGYDGIVYLNRYEGFSREVIKRLEASGHLGKLDLMRDGDIRKIVPEAQDSYIIFDPSKIKILSVEACHPQTAQKAPPAPPESDLEP